VYGFCAGAGSVPSNTCILRSEWVNSDGKRTGNWEWHSHEAGVACACNSQCYWDTRQQHETAWESATANSDTPCSVNIQQQSAALIVQLYCLQWDHNQWWVLSSYAFYVRDYDNLQQAWCVHIHKVLLTVLGPWKQFGSEGQRASHKTGSVNGTH
jgi:hypothetical protein